MINIGVRHMKKTFIAIASLITLPLAAGSAHAAINADALITETSAISHMAVAYHHDDSKNDNYEHGKYDNEHHDARYEEARHDDRRHDDARHYDDRYDDRYDDEYDREYAEYKRNRKDDGTGGLILGGAVGAGAGALLGGTKGAIIGGLGGALLGREIDKSEDKPKRRKKRDDY